MEDYNDVNVESKLEIEGLENGLFVSIVTDVYSESEEFGYDYRIRSSFEINEGVDYSNLLYAHLVQELMKDTGHNGGERDNSYDSFFENWKTVCKQISENLKQNTHQEALKRIESEVEHLKDVWGIEARDYGFGNGAYFIDLVQVSVKGYNLQDFLNNYNNFMAGVVAMEISHRKNKKN